MTAEARPLSILVCALGGEGGGVLCEWLVDAARHAGYPVQGTSIPGVAQRTGATTYYLEIFPQPTAQLGGQRPVLSLYPVPGALDLLLSSELLESARQIGQGMATAQRTQVISSTARALTTHERMQLGDGRIGDDALASIVRKHSREHHLFDMNAVARETGTVVSAVMFGALSGSGALPFPRAACEAVIRDGGQGAEASLRGFARAFDIVAAARARVAFVQQVAGECGAPAASAAAPVGPGAASGMAPAVTPAVTPPVALPAALRDRFPAAVHELLALGHSRVGEYQDAAYAELYVERMARIVDAERSADPQAAGDWAITRETARHLALWMAFDDIVRVAELKCRAARRERVRAEVRASDGELLRVYDHFKPGVSEFAALLPATPARALQRWDRGRQARGREPFALPLKLATHSVGGLLALRLLASLRWLRRRGERFAQEQALIERWLRAIDDGARADWALGHEIALCGRLIKGYGSTNERGKTNLLHVVDHLAQAAAAGSAPQRALAVRAARTAALADEAGTALDQTLQQHGAPARPVAAVPVRFVRPAKARARA